MTETRHNSSGIGETVLNTTHACLLICLLFLIGCLYYILQACYIRVLHKQLTICYKCIDDAYIYTYLQASCTLLLIENDMINKHKKTRFIQSYRDRNYTEDLVSNIP
jgi:hypothetical protein